VTTIRFVQHDGREQVIEANDGQTVMRVAQDNGVPGIVADCGGFLSCATCHVYIDANWVSRIPPATEDETTMLELAVDPNESSRLSCQIQVNPEIDGLIVNIPERQY